MNDVRQTVSYDQYNNIPSQEGSAVIFNESQYKTLMTLLLSASKSNQETGCFFVGKKISENPTIIYIESSTSNFACQNGIYENGAVLPTTHNYTELNSEIQKYRQLGIKPCVIHFHAHTLDGFYESFSDQDLHTYAKMDFDNSSLCQSYGMLGFPYKKSVGITTIMPTNSQCINGNYSANFHRLSDIYYCLGNEIYKIGTFDKRYNGRKTPISGTLGTVRNATTVNSSKKISAIGIDPNTGLSIQDSNVGYIDINNTINIPSENLSLNINVTNNSHSAHIR